MNDHVWSHPGEVIGNGRAAGVRTRLADGTVETPAADFVFIGTGERANSAPFVQALGVEVDEQGSIVADRRMRTSVPGVYAIGDLIGPPMEMFKARKCGMIAARSVMGEPYEFDFSECPDFLHSTYEISWVGLTEAEAWERFGDVIFIQMPPAGVEPDEIPLPCAEGSKLHAFTRPELTGFRKCVIDAATRRVVGRTMWASAPRIPSNTSTTCRAAQAD